MKRNTNFKIRSSISILLLFGILPTSAQKTVNEIDRLCSKYKDGEDIVIYSTSGEIDAKVSIERNVDEQPQSITIHGQTNSIDIVSEAVHDLIQQKIAQGFVYYSGDNIAGYIVDRDIGKRVTGLGYIKSKLKELKSKGQWTQAGLKVATFETIYKKGTLYFYVTINRNKYDAQKSMSDLGFSKHSYDTCYFNLINGDNNRKGGSNARKFEF